MRNYGATTDQSDGKKIGFQNPKEVSITKNHKQQQTGYLSIKTESAHCHISKANYRGLRRPAEADVSVMAMLKTKISWLLFPK